MKPEDLVHTDRLRALAVEIAWKFLKEPYRYAGDDPIKGFDCSGLVVEVLQSVGLIRHGTDYRAADLEELFGRRKVERPRPGCLAFWRDSLGRVVHVMLVIDDIDKGHVIGAAGGGETTRTEEDAARQNAFVKIRPLDYWKNKWPEIVDPFLEDPT